MINITSIKEVNHNKEICLNINCPRYKVCEISAHLNKEKGSNQNYVSYDYRKCERNKKDA